MSGGSPPEADIAALEQSVVADAMAAQSVDQLEQIRVAVLGKKGSLSGLLARLGGLDAEARRAQGEVLNRLKARLVAVLADRRTALDTAALADRLASERVDVTLPAYVVPSGLIHPISRTIDEVVAIFGQMGFSVAEGPDIEDDFHNFTALNFPVGHPARDMHDTFYLDGRDQAGERYVLRTHTSPVQIRTMERVAPPIRVIIPGRCYRSDSDQTHSPMFHQVEGLVIDRTTHMGHLKGCLTEFLRAYFDLPDVPLRFRPSFFPFTEPSAEVDIGCSRKDGGLVLGHGGDWLEILGCGMVHPNVLRSCGLDPAEYQGFAFGMGLERIAMLKYAIPDLRPFFDGDLRWLRHYGFAPFDVPSLITGLSP